MAARKNSVPPREVILYYPQVEVTMFKGGSAVNPDFDHLYGFCTCHGLFWGWSDLWLQSSKEVLCPLRKVVQHG
jgi:hypothetical protein